MGTRYYDNTIDAAGLKKNGSGVIVEMIPITWAALKAARDGGTLVPGQQYRITDYTCTTTTTNTNSANHPFDIIVRADDVNKLNEVASAIQHKPAASQWVYSITFTDGVTKNCYLMSYTAAKYNIIDCETLLGIENQRIIITDLSGTAPCASTDLNKRVEPYYFANNDLQAWQLWYCLDNDTTRFGWADATNGKGVIYRMIDEFGNDVPYDFKNILFTRLPSLFINCPGDTLQSTDQYFREFTRKESIDFELDGTQYYGWANSARPADQGQFFTQTLSVTTSTKLYDSSGVEQSNLLAAVNPGYENAYTFSGRSNGVAVDASSVPTNYQAGTVNQCYDNVIKRYRPITGEQKFGLNFTVFYPPWDNYYCECHNNFIADDNYNNLFLDSTFTRNTIGVYCQGNFARERFASNIIGASFCFNVILKDISHNNIGTGFSYNTVGDNFYSNTVATGFVGNVIGGSVTRNVFGSEVQRNYFGETPLSDIRITCCTFDSNVKYILFTSADTIIGIFNEIQNVHVHSGVAGSSSNLLTVSVPARALTYETSYTMAGATEHVL